MKLLEIWNAVPAWKTLSLLKKSSRLAYRLMKYLKAIDAEVAVCEARRQECVYGITGKQPGEAALIENDTPQFAELVVKFTEFLQEESDLPPVGITMEELIEDLGAEDGNRISEADLNLLEPFFKVQTTQASA